MNGNTEETLYIALVSTPGIFAGMIRRVIKREYIHVVLSLDQGLYEAYSVGRRNPFIPFWAGFEKENAAKICRKYPMARYRIYPVECTGEQKERIRRVLRECYCHRFRYHYCILGLPFLLLNRPFFQKRHYTCSSFIARLLSEQGIHLFDRHFSLVTPADFYDLKDRQIVYEGLLSDFLRLRSMSGREKGKGKKYVLQEILYEG